MNKLFGALLFLVLSLSHSSILQAQKIATLFYDTQWLLTVGPDIEYFRTCIIDTVKQSFYGDVKDYYRNGKPQMSGKYYDNIKVDSFRFFYNNGQLEAKGIYVDNMRAGRWTFFYRSGRLKEIVEFFPDDFRILESYDTAGHSLLVNGTGMWTHSYKLPGLWSWIRIEGEYRNGKRHGKWKAFEHSGNEVDERLEYTDKFDNGVLKTPWYAGTFLTNYFPDYDKFKVTESFMETNIVSRPDYPYIRRLRGKVDSLTLPFDKSALFPGGEEAYNHFIDRNLKYPELAKKDAVSCSVHADFIIDKNGNVTDIRTPLEQRNADKSQYGFEAELRRLISTFPKWRPATRDGRNVAQRQYLTINFAVKNISVEMAPFVRNGRGERVKR